MHTNTITIVKQHILDGYLAMMEMSEHYTSEEAKRYYSYACDDIAFAEDSFLYLLGVSEGYLETWYEEDEKLHITYEVR